MKNSFSEALHVEGAMQMELNLIQKTRVGFVDD